MKDIDPNRKKEVQRKQTTKEQKKIKNKIFYILREMRTFCMSETSMEYF